MVVETPFQFRSEKGNLPIIKHPSTKLADPAELNLRGTSRLTSRVNSRCDSSRISNVERLSVIERLELPLIPDGVEVKVSSDRSHAHIPIFGQSAEITNRIESRLTQYSNASNSSRSSSRMGTTNEMSVGEIEGRLRHKVRTGYFTLKNLFLSYEPDGTSVERNLNMLVDTWNIKNYKGHITLHASYYSAKLLANNGKQNRMNQGDRLGISPWNEPKLRSSNTEYDVNIYTSSNLEYVSGHENIIKFISQTHAKERDINESEYPDWLEQHQQSERQATCNQVHTYLKNLEEKDLLVKTLDILPNGKIYKPVLLEKLRELGYKMKPLEMEKLWSRYDPLNSSSILVQSLRDALNGKNIKFTQAQKHSNTQRLQSLTIEKWLNKTMRRGAKNFLAAFREYDLENTEVVSRENFLDVLKNFDLYLKDKELDLFLERCNVEHDGDKISYKDFIQMFQCRNEDGFTSKVLHDNNHRFHKSMDDRTIKTSLSNIETRLVDLFQKDYFTLMNKFRKIDKSGDGTLTEIEFRAALESFFEDNFTDYEFSEFIEKFRKPNRKIDYLAFLSKFDVRTSQSLFDVTSVNDADECDAQTLRTISQSTKRTDSTRLERSMDDVWHLVSLTVRQKSSDIEKIFRELDVKNTDRMSMDTFRKLLRRIGVTLTKNETEKLWENLIVDQHGTLHYQQFLKHFSFSIKSAAFPNSKTRPPERGDSDCRILSKQFNSWLDLIKGYARVALDREYSKLYESFVENDENMCGSLQAKVFQRILEDTCSDLSRSEIAMLTNRIAVSGSVNWKRFLSDLKPKKLISETGYDMSDILRHR